jgi:hypothetical protein
MWSPAYDQVGNYTVTFSVSDGTVSTSRNATYTAIKINYAPYFLSSSEQTQISKEGSLIMMSINANDWNQDVLTYSATNLPIGATVDSTNHIFLWTPGYNQSGTYNITLVVSDGKLQSSQAFHIIVEDTLQPVSQDTRYYIKLE